jgi:hypothetical protein
VHEQRTAHRGRGLLDETSPTWSKGIRPGCFVVPVSGAFAYVISGVGGLIADLIACAVILPAIWWFARRGQNAA